MTFPIPLPLFGQSVPAHFVFESFGYFTGARIYFIQRRRNGGGLPLETNLWLLVGCIFGAWMGSKLLAWAETPSHYWAMRQDPGVLLGGKTIVGGLLGGWAGIEFAKQRLRITQSTGDLFVWPLAVGTAIGRIGCFLTGLTDHTYGVATTLPWGVDFGDGIARHPTQLYESLYAVLLATAVSWSAYRDWPAGARFRCYFAGYFAFRFLVEFIKPRETPLLGLSAIQLASFVGAVLALVSFRQLRHTQPAA